MKKYILLILSFVSILIGVSCADHKKTSLSSTTNELAKEIPVVTSKTFGRAFNFMILGDWGRNGDPVQQEVADQMAKTADSVDARFIATCGDNFQINGVASVQDPLWLLNFENVYKGNSLQVDWFPVLGNHDYKGNTQAQIDYSGISRRWRMTDHYYSFAKRINDSISARFIFLDTPPLVGEYRNNPDEYPDAAKQNIEKELEWLKNTLANSKEQWKLVFGHHPVYSASQKHGNTEEMIARVKPLFDKFNVQVYFCGHDHDFQRLHEKGLSTDYIVTGTGSEVRPCNTNEMSLFSRSEPGFSVVSFKGDSIRICFVGTKGNLIYSFGRNYEK
jgi:tartrate-resistant acid phosphatase type 5